MTTHVLVAREGRVRLFHVNGRGAEEVASLVVSGPLPSDEELASWAGALIHMTAPRALDPAPARRKAGAPKALPAGKPRAKGVHGAPGSLLRVVLRAFSDGEWRSCSEAFDIAAGAIARKGSVSATIATARRNNGAGWWENRVVDNPTGRAGGVFQYRITDEGRAKLAELDAALG